ncbi:hypothetical protein CSUI_011331, partial [Cystoisospora suis]
EALTREVRELTMRVHAEEEMKEILHSQLEEAYEHLAFARADVSAAYAGGVGPGNARLRGLRSPPPPPCS